MLLFQGSIGILEGEASYLLGNAYLENENMEIALTYFHKYYDISKNEKNYENLGKAAEALAKCYEKYSTNAFFVLI